MTDDSPEVARVSGAAGSAPRGAGPLVGREREVAQLAHLVTQTHGHGHALVVEGRAGVGKSRLVAEAAATASAHGFRQLWLRPVPDRRTPEPAGGSAAPGPAPAHVDGLPCSRVDLLTALEDFRAPTQEPLLARLAVLRVLEEAATEQPLLVVVEDAQWCDPWVTDLVGFVGRRLSRAPILVLVTSRLGLARDVERYKLPRLNVGALSRAESERVLDDLPGALSASTRARVLREAAGIPSALLEGAAALRGHATLTGPQHPPHLTDLVSAFAAGAERPRAVSGGRDEPVATAPPVPEGSSTQRAPLTPQELYISQLAATGLTNREIAERVFLSHRTVGAHLYRAFPKLGVTRRSQLQQALLKR